MNNQPNQPFDKEQVYDEQIEPLVRQIIEICKANDMPLALSVCYGWSEEVGFTLCSTIVPAEGWQVDQFERFRQTLRHNPIFLAMAITRAK